MLKSQNTSVEETEVTDTASTTNTNIDLYTYVKILVKTDIEGKVVPEITPEQHFSVFAKLKDNLYLVIGPENFTGKFYGTDLEPERS